MSSSPQEQLPSKEHVKDLAIGLQNAVFIQSQSSRFWDIDSLFCKLYPLTGRVELERLNMVNITSLKHAADSGQRSEPEYWEIIFNRAKQFFFQETGNLSNNDFATVFKQFAIRDLARTLDIVNELGDSQPQRILAIKKAVQEQVIENDIAETRSTSKLEILLGQCQDNHLAKEKIYKELIKRPNCELLNHLASRDLTDLLDLRRKGQITDQDMKYILTKKLIQGKTRDWFITLVNPELNLQDIALRAIDDTLPAETPIELTDPFILLGMSELDDGKFLGVIGKFLAQGREIPQELDSFAKSKVYQFLAGMKSGANMYELGYLQGGNSMYSGITHGIEYICRTNPEEGIRLWRNYIREAIGKDRAERKQNEKYFSESQLDTLIPGFASLANTNTDLFQDLMEDGKRWLPVRNELFWKSLSEINDPEERQKFIQDFLIGEYGEVKINGKDGLMEMFHGCLSKDQQSTLLAQPEIQQFIIKLFKDKKWTNGGDPGLLNLVCKPKDIQTLAIFAHEQFESMAIAPNEILFALYFLPQLVEEKSQYITDMLTSFRSLSERFEKTIPEIFRNTHQPVIAAIMSVSPELMIEIFEKIASYASVVNSSEPNSKLRSEYNEWTNELLTSCGHIAHTSQDAQKIKEEIQKFIGGHPV